MCGPARQDFPEIQCRRVDERNYPRITDPDTRSVSTSCEHVTKASVFWSPSTHTATSRLGDELQHDSRRNVWEPRPRYRRSTYNVVLSRQRGVVKLQSIIGYGRRHFGYSFLLVLGGPCSFKTLTLLVVAELASCRGIASARSPSRSFGRPELYVT